MNIRSKGHNHDEPPITSEQKGWIKEMECKDGHISHLYKRTEVAGEKEAIITDMD